MPPPRPRLAAEPLEPRDVPAAGFATFPILPADDPAVLDHARAIVARGRAAGRSPDVVMRVGDSNSDPGYGAGYLYPLGAAGYDPFGSGLAAVAPGVLDTLAAYRSGGGINSFARVSEAVVLGSTVGSITPRVPREAAATGAGVALVMIGTNDAYLGTDPAAYRSLLTAMVDGLAAAGVVPVLSTIPENLAFGPVVAARATQINQLIADVAESARVPLWNYWRGLAAVPGLGLGSDRLHLSASPDGGGTFTGGSLVYGQNVRNLEALQVLDWFRERVVGGLPEPVAVSRGWTSQAGKTVYAVGRDLGQAPAVTVYDAADGRELNRFLAFEPTFAGGVRVAVADVTGDGVPDVVAGAGPGGGPVVKVFSGADGSVAASFYAYEPTFRGGVGSVAAADLDGDGAAEVVVGAGDGGGPVVAVYRGRDLAGVARFAAYEASFRGGVNVAAGVFAGVGPAVVTGAGRGGGPVVRLFAFGSDAPAASFFALDPADAGGLAVAAGDLDGDGFAEVAAGPAVGVPRVQVFDGSGAVRASFFAGPLDRSTGVRLAIRAGQLLVGNGTGVRVSVRTYSGLSLDEAALPPDEPGRAYGVFVG